MCALSTYLNIMALVLLCGWEVILTGTFSVCVLYLCVYAQPSPAPRFQTDLACLWQIDAAYWLGPSLMKGEVTRWNSAICHSTLLLIHFVAGHRAQCHINWLDWWEKTAADRKGFPQSDCILRSLLSLLSLLAHNVKQVSLKKHVCEVRHYTTLDTLMLTFFDYS